jgi:ubiquitin-protein ligase
MMSNRRIYIKDTSGNNYESDIESNITVGNIAADFFETMDWPLNDSDGRRQRAVVEFLDPKTGKYTRLRQDQTLEDANIPDGAVLSIYPESIAGTMGSRRLAVLKRDQLEMSRLSADYAHITFTTQSTVAPDEYLVTFTCKSFTAPPLGEGKCPETGKDHCVRINLLSDYPREAPLLDWLTPLFHPNVTTEGAVCMGQLNERYLPGLGLKRIVLLLDEMLHWRNYDLFNSFNQEAALWAVKPASWPFIEQIGGISFNYTYQELIDPSNWGNTAKESAIFKGIDQPRHLLEQWKKEKLRPRIKFLRTIQTESI